MSENNVCKIEAVVRLGMKKCIGCNKEKEICDKNFGRKEKGKKFNNKCKDCVKKYKKEYRKKNPEKTKEQSKKWRTKRLELHGKEVKKYYQEYNKFYYQENKNTIIENSKKYNEEHREERRVYHNEYQKDRRNNEITLRIRDAISGSIRSVLKGNKKRLSILKHLPYTMEELRKHIEKQFKKPGNEWMNWDNWGVYSKKNHDTNRTWQIDHIQPHSDFHYKDMKCKEFQECWALSNLRPLDSKENLMDGVNRARHSKK